MRPASRGRLGLKSTDPNDSPMFQSSILEHPEDMDVRRRGLPLPREIFNQLDGRYFQSEEILPGLDISSKTSSNTLDDVIRSQARTISHPAGTCRMGIELVIEFPVMVLNQKALYVLTQFPGC